MGLNNLHAKWLEAQIEHHFNLLHNPPEDISLTYKKYYVSYHLNEVERLEEELEKELNKE
jgi:hypothetical protein